MDSCALTDFFTSWTCFEFWLNRYQTLLAALLAGGLVFVSVRPAWRQVAIMQGQLDVQERKIRMADYHNITRAITLFEKPEWPSEVGRDPWRDRDLYLNAEDPIAKIDAGFEDRVSALDKLKANLAAIDLPAEARQISDAQVSRIEGLFGQYRAYPTSERADELRNNGQPNDPGERWFYKVSMPDQVIANFGKEARDKLDLIRTRLFEEANKAF